MQVIEDHLKIFVGVELKCVVLLFCLQMLDWQHWSWTKQLRHFILRYVTSQQYNISMSSCCLLHSSTGIPADLLIAVSYQELWLTASSFLMWSNSCFHASHIYYYTHIWLSVHHAAHDLLQKSSKCWSNSMIIKHITLYYMKCLECV